MSKMLKVVGASWLQTKISSYILGFLGMLAIMSLFIGLMDRIQEDGTYAATVFHSDKTGYRIEYWGQSNKLADIQRGVARAYFRTDIDTNGWSILEVETDGSYPDHIQAYAAGIVEGGLTWSLIHTHLENTIRAQCDNTPLEKNCDKLRDALDKSANIWKNYASKHENTDPFWHQVSLYYIQLAGIFTGWQHGVTRSQNEYDTDISDLYWLNAVGEVAELQHKLNISLLDPIAEQLPSPSSSFFRLVKDQNGHDTNKILIAHNAAGSYNTMMKIIKRYKLNYHVTAAPDSVLVPATSVEFSGYPGSITSQDEFYLNRGEGVRMAVVGTSIKNYNRNLWKDVNITEQVPVGPRVSAANRLARNASSWAHLLATSNSGTGCKQWILADLHRFDALASGNMLNNFVPNTLNLPEIVTENYNDVRHTVVHRGGGGGRARGLLWLLEQAPARTHSADISDAFLERTYWFTHGIPAFKDIFEVTNTSKMEEVHGDLFSESLSPRALAFKRGYKNATSLNSVIKLMRSNNMTAVGRANEEQRRGGAGGALSALWVALGLRADLDDDYHLPYGVVDTKVMRYIANSKGADFIAVAGPPYTPVAKSNETDSPVNKATIAALYTDHFDDQTDIDSAEIRDLYKHEREEAIEEYIEERDKNIIKPFQWSESPFSDQPHKGLPDKWAFDPYKVKWAW